MLHPKISLAKLDDEESSLKHGEWRLHDGHENFFSVFEEGWRLEDKMICKVFFLMISWEEKSKVLLSYEIFFEFEDKIEGRWLDPVFKAGKDLVCGINAHCISYLGWLANLEGEEWEGWWLVLISEIRIEEISFNSGRN